MTSVLDIYIPNLAQCYPENDIIKIEFYFDSYLLWIDWLWAHTWNWYCYWAFGRMSVSDKNDIYGRYTGKRV